MEDKFEYVDLGLTSGTLWANQNLPGYYAFGEFKEKESYTLDNSITFYKDKKKLILEGLCDYKGNIISNHSFSIPTKEQFLELMSECTWKWDNDLLGYTITSNKNNNSIFLGTEGYKLKTDIIDKGIWGNYWTSTLIDGQFYASYLYFFKNAIYYGNHSERFYGRSIRPVLNTNVNDLIDLNLPSGTLWNSANLGADSPLYTGNIVAYGEIKDKDLDKYDISHWEFAINDSTTEVPNWTYRFSDKISTKSMWDEVENYKHQKVKALKEYPKKDWNYNLTDLEEPTESDWLELAANIDRIEDKETYKIVYFNNTYEVLIFTPGHIENGEEKSNYYYWTKDLVSSQLLNTYREAKYADISLLNSQLNPGILPSIDLVQGLQLRYVKKPNKQNYDIVRL